MASLANRLEKLENDLQMLTAMQHLIAESDDMTLGTNNSADLHLLEIPTRDIPIVNNNGSNSKMKPKGIGRKPAGGVGSVKVARPTSDATPQEASHSPLAGNDKEYGHPPIELESNQEWKEMSLELVNLKTKLMEKERNLLDLEKLKGNLASEMLKKEDELEREKDCKNGLLRLTLQLKNQIHEKENRINSLESTVGTLKAEKEKITDDVGTLRRNTEKIDIESRDLLQRQNALTEVNERLKQEVTQLERQQKMLEHTSTTHEQKLMVQLNQLVAKCAQIDQSREVAQMTSKKIQERLDEKEAEVEELEDKVTKLESERERSAMLHECALNKLQLDLETQSASVDQKIASCHTVLSQTKDMFIKLSLEKQELEQALMSSLDSSKVLTMKLEESQQALRELEKVRSLESGNSNSSLAKTEEELKKLKHKNHKFQRLLLKMKLENAQLRKNCDTAEENWGKQVQCLEEEKHRLEEDNGTFRKELKNVNDNFSILQKISQDQIGSLQKLKSEVEERRKSESGLKAQLRNSEDAVEVLRRKLGTEEQRVQELEEEVEYLQHKQSELESDLKNHNCEDWVESTCKKKLAILETQVKNKEGEFERSIRDLKSERDKAISAAKRAVNKAVEMKAEWETNLLELRSQAKQDALKAQVETRREVSEKNLQIQSLEVELEKVRQLAAQNHRTLSQKIHQLQSALNVCVGTFSQQPPLPVQHQQFTDSSGISQTFGSLFLS